MADIINIKNEMGEAQYPITKPECVIDENGKNVRQKLTELSEEVSGLSEKIENLPTAESSVFEAIYGVTTYDEILNAYNAGKIVVCNYNGVIYRLTYVTNVLHFAAQVNDSLMYVRCPQSNRWQQSIENTDHSLETLANGNAKITIAGQSAEVATPQYVEEAIQQSGTPSGDPMHYMFEAVGAEWNGTGADIVRTGIYGDTITWKAGYWWLNELGDITNEEMRQIYLYANLDNGAKAINKYLSSIGTRTNIVTWSSTWSGKIKDQEVFSYAPNVIVARMRDKEHYIDTNASYAFIGCTALQKILPTLDATSTTSFNGIFDSCNNLREVRIKNVKVAIKFNYSPLISKASILYLIQNSAATSAMVITLHADAYARLAEDADIVAALAEKTNVSLAK